MRRASWRTIRRSRSALARSEARESARRRRALQGGYSSQEPSFGRSARPTTNSVRTRSTTGGTFTGGSVDFTHAAVDAVAKWRGVAVQGEYLWRLASVDAIASRASDGSARTEATRSARGWIAQASYVFDPPIEIVARASRMVAFGGTDPLFVQELAARGQELGAGVNVYLNGHALKVQLSWIARTSPSLDLGAAEHAAYALVDATM
jgi:hypothetical protein